MTELKKLTVKLFVRKYLVMEKTAASKFSGSTFQQLAYYAVFNYHSKVIVVGSEDLLCGWAFW